MDEVLEARDSLFFEDFEFKNLASEKTSGRSPASRNGQVSSFIAFGELSSNLVS